MAEWPSPQGVDVYCVLLPRFLLLDFAGPAEAFRLANDYGGKFRLHLIGPEPTPNSSLGLPVHAVEALPERVPEHAWVMLSGVTESAKDYATPAARQTWDCWRARYAPATPWPVSVPARCWPAWPGCWMAGAAPPTIR